MVGVLAGLSGALALGCTRPPPASQFPTARDALSRISATERCSRGLAGEARVDIYDRAGRVRGKLLFVAMLPDRVRLDSFSPLGAVISTLTADGDAFQLYDAREGRFLYGPASACNLSRFIGVPVPAHALVELFDGRAPVLRHEPSDARVAWEGGRYAVTIRGAHQAEELIELVPLEADWHLPWSEQRVHVLRVLVRQAGVALYEAELGDFEPARTAAPRVDPDGLAPPIPPSGPACDAELPRRLRLLVPGERRDLLVEVESVEHNPPLTAGLFAQPVPASADYVTCAVEAAR